MKRLVILRHAKSSWDHPGLRDFDRPLNARGQAAARLVGEELKRRQVMIDHVIASPAVRVRETLGGLAETYGELTAISFDEGAYLASVGHLLDRIQRLPESAATAMLVGHNPGLHTLVLKLARRSALRDAVEAKFPTAAVAILKFATADWRQAETGKGELTALILARDLSQR